MAHHLLMTDKRYVNAVILAGIFGVLGIHHFYVKRYAMGFLDLGLFIATVITYFQEQYLIAGILFLLDMLHTIFVTYLLLVGQYKDGNGNLITYPGQNES